MMGIKFRTISLKKKKKPQRNNLNISTTSAWSSSEAELSTNLHPSENETTNLLYVLSEFLLAPTKCGTWPLWLMLRPWIGVMVLMEIMLQMLEDDMLMFHRKEKDDN